MPDRIGHLMQLCVIRIATSALALSLFALAPRAAWPQAAPPASLGLQSPAQQPLPAQPAPQQIEPQPAAPAENPGLINEIGKLFEKSKSLLPTIKSPGETIDDLNARAKDAAKDAGDSLTNIAKDCKAGADKLCQSKGYKEGKSLDTDAAEKCSPKVFIPGRQREPGDCKTENYVIRALCQ
jgi:hypothetical protein